MSGKRIRKAAAVVVCASLAMPGCSAFQPRQETVTITASVPGAPVFVDNKPVGASPVMLKLDREKTYAVSATASGRTGVAAIGRKISGAGVLDIIGGVLFLVPFVGCATPGFWELDPKAVTVQIPTDEQLSTPASLPPAPAPRRAQPSRR